MIRGAEAIITFSGEEVIKERLKKGYRYPELDVRLRKQRTRSEARLLGTARRHGLLVPGVLDTSEYTILMNKIPGERVKEALEKQPSVQVLKQIGEAAGRLHEAGIMHGDLTTSNMILSPNGLALIDFGLSKNSKRAEDHAMDLFLLYEALTATHHSILRDWPQLLNTYKKTYSNASVVLTQFEKIRARRRYKGS